MGYFSNGTEGELYQRDHCDDCVHWDPDEGCPVWDAHILYNYQEPMQIVLDMFIPRKGVFNDMCKMYFSLEDVDGG